jgi:putative transposase
MSYYLRVILRGGVYFFTVVTHDRIPLVHCEERVALLRKAFRKAKAARPFAVDAMVVLPEHLHCIWRLPDGDGDFSGRWREIKKAVSREIDARTNAHGELPVWQRRFWEHAIRDEADWRRHVDYIHYNPVKHGLVARPGDWPWSSFGRAVALGWYEASWGAAAPADVVGMKLE